MKKVFYKYNIFYIILFLLLFINIAIFIFVYKNRGCNLNRDLIAFLDVGQGDAIYIENKKGENILIDTGNKESHVFEQIKKIKTCSRFNIDYLILTHPDQDHIGEAYNLINKNIVKKVIHNGFLDIDQKDESKTENDLELIIKDKHIYTQNIVNNKYINFENFVISFVFPWDATYIDKDKKKDDNYYSIVMKIEKGDKSFLLTGDASHKTERDILDKYCFKKNTCVEIESDILKLGHHGSKTSSSYDFLKMVNADEYIVSASKNNKYNHPHQETINIIKLLNKKDSHIRETFSEGNIIYILD